jgi:type VI secretion system secreted protein Hcp
MKFEGVDGSVTAHGHEKWVELTSCQLGVNRHVTNPTGRGVNREASAPSVHEISISKAMDCASVGLFKASLWGEGKKVKIDFCKTDKDKVEPFLQIELENTLVSSYSCSGHGGGDGVHGRPHESLSMNFTKISYHSIHMDHANKTGKPDRTPRARNCFDRAGRSLGWTEAACSARSRSRERMYHSEEKITWLGSTRSAQTPGRETAGS